MWPIIQNGVLFIMWQIIQHYGVLFIMWPIIQNGVYCSSCGRSFKMVYCSSCGQSFKLVYCSSCGQSFKMASWSHVANQSKSHFVVSHSKWHLVHHDDKIFQNGHSFATCILPSKGFLPWHNYLKLRFFPGVEFFSILYIIGERLRNKQIWCISISIHRRRLKTEEKAKVVADAWGTK